MSAHRITRLPPLSGRDRRHFAREAARAGSAYDEMMRQAESKRAEAEQALKAADRRMRGMVWSLAVWPRYRRRVTDPRTGDQCRQYRAVDLTTLRMRLATRLASIEPSLSCTPCRRENENETAKDGKHRWKPRAVIVDISMPLSPVPEPEIPHQVSTTQKARLSDCVR